MPELPDTMYCSEQICIPPTFPYLLRQYAKSAIRTQPTDLLKWSTAYFRCLSLNIPPPVKPRLEYPIPRDYAGVTPGWLKALLYQLPGNQTVSFRILWDRWTGACLEHKILIKLLCLAGFDKPEAVPWLRFIAMCAAHLTDDLTHTMILICEILTEEPEGGSAMITVETFLDLYKFLARIDASEPQVLKNIYFRDSLLVLWGQKKEKIEAAIEERAASVKEASGASIGMVSEGTIEEEDLGDDLREVVSCPSIADDTYKAFYYLEGGKAVADEQEEEGEPQSEEQKEAEVIEEEPQKDESDLTLEGGEDEEGEYFGEGEEGTQTPPEEHKRPSIEGGEEAGDLKPSTSEEQQQIDDVRDETKGEDETKPGIDTVKVEGEEPDIEKNHTIEESQEEGEKLEETIDQDKVVEDGAKTSDEEGSVLGEKEEGFEDETTLKEDLERLKMLQEQELAGETDEEMEKFKTELIEALPLTKSIESAIDHFRDVDKKGVTTQRVPGVDDEGSEEEGKEPEEQYEEVYVNAIPGIGGIVPEPLIQAVCNYMKRMAKIQHGMVMPRNIRHYSCPPLEVLE